MTDLGRPPIDPFSDAQWTRVERGLWERFDGEPVVTRTPARRRWLWLAVPASVAMAAAILLLVVGGHDPQPRIDPARIVAGSAPSSITLGDVFIELDANSAVQADGDHTIVERGAAWFTVAPRGARERFVVDAGDATIRVLGTRFRVARDGEHVSAAVDHGLVEVTFRGGVVRLLAGQHWSSDQPTVVATNEAPPPPPPPAVVTPPAPVAPTRPPPSHPKLDPDRAEFERLAAVEPRDPDAAIVGYLALSGSSSTWAEPALYAAGRIAFDHHDRRAATLLTVYLKRFPHGQNAVVARQILDRLQGATP